MSRQSMRPWLGVLHNFSFFFLRLTRYLLTQRSQIPRAGEQHVSFCELIIVNMLQINGYIITRYVKSAYLIPMTIVTQ